ncbi:Zinc finger, C2H2 domain-containing protein [Rozella allomycis CSF55]|uniref:Zinc finger, C2H2 domain-containing protein n=1 Tax=Rozella allomycis (strain CSF55) TaxID=988480 RepID=A0A075AXD7_ROZAC|nr:Zinc finger, C2H2 domain-containing protein [Rozella allomycis CSF55]|eukprot:EPZ34917.1 Zinc finger, C2H2 domain-containing protein [Rozella allomycis CSF55]
MIFDLEKSYSLEEFLALNENTEFPVEIDGEIISGFELLGNGKLSAMPQATVFMEKTVVEIITILRAYASSSICPGDVTSSQGGFKFEVLDQDGRVTKKIRAPNVSFIPRRVMRTLDANQLFTFKGEPFTPTFVVEESTFNKLKKKVLDDYFSNRSSIELVWIIDPENRRAVEFYRNRQGRPIHRDHQPWVNLSGRNVLPSFELDVKALKYVLEKNLLSETSEENDEDDKEFHCPECDFTFHNRADFKWHYKSVHVIPATRAKEDRKRARGKSLSPRKKRK